MKICHITSAHQSNDVRIFYKECTSLAKAGYETYLVAQGESRNENGVQVIGVGDAPTNRIARMAFFTKKVYKKALEVDAEIYHLHDPELLPYGLKLKKRGKQVIFDSHEDTLNQMEDKTWIPRVIRPIISNKYVEFAQRAFTKYDAIISVTPHIVNDLKQINNKTVMICNFPQLETNIEIEKPEDYQICFTGGINAQWNHENILKAIEQKNEIKYLLCGGVNEKYLENLKKFEAWDKVDYKGKISHEKAKFLQAESHVGMALLQPSNNTGGCLGTLGNTKLFEYMMAGIPVICTNFILWQEIIKKYNCGICVDPSNVDEISSAIQYLLDHQEEARQMGINGRKAVEEEFNWSKEEKKLIELYDGLKAR